MLSGSTFASRLVAAMGARHLTVPELAETLGYAVSERTIFRWRAGAAAPGAEALPLLARALHTTPNDLLGWESA
jgi:transcriptional regulator with XRE-family HTH domain